jgi:hypothetical protein
LKYYILILEFLQVVILKTWSRKLKYAGDNRKIKVKELRGIGVQIGGNSLAHCICEWFQIKIYQAKMWSGEALEQSESGRQGCI